MSSPVIWTAWFDPLPVWNAWFDTGATQIVLRNPERAQTIVCVTGQRGERGPQGDLGPGSEWQETDW
jgi:hypothetical protein